MRYATDLEWSRYNIMLILMVLLALAMSLYKMVYVILIK